MTLAGWYSLADMWSKISRASTANLVHMFFYKNIIVTYISRRTNHLEVYLCTTVCCNRLYLTEKKKKKDFATHRQRSSLPVGKSGLQSKLPTEEHVTGESRRVKKNSSIAAIVFHCGFKKQKHAKIGAGAPPWLAFWCTVLN